jgi:hypothetical protein
MSVADEFAVKKRPAGVFAALPKRAIADTTTRGPRDGKVANGMWHRSPHKPDAAQSARPMVLIKGDRRDRYRVGVLTYDNLRREAQMIRDALEGLISRSVTLVIWFFFRVHWGKMARRRSPATNASRKAVSPGP